MFIVAKKTADPGALLNWLSWMLRSLFDSLHDFGLGILVSLVFISSWSGVPSSRCQILSQSPFCGLAAPEVPEVAPSEALVGTVRISALLCNDINIVLNTVTFLEGSGANSRPADAH